MGRWPWSDRKTVEECTELSVGKMLMNGVFEKGPGSLWSSTWTNSLGKETGSIGFWFRRSPEGVLYLQLSYTITRGNSHEKTPVEYPVGLTTTQCNFGGVRYWFICPLVVDDKPCMRRVGKLYLPPGGKYFGCRHCYNLTYKSCKEHDKRVDALVKNPDLMLARMRDGTAKPRDMLLILKAYDKVMRRTL